MPRSAPSRFALALSLSLAISAESLHSQLRTPAAASAPTAIPSLVPYSGLAMAADGNPLRGEVNMTFLIYKDEIGGEPLWSESQVATIDLTGHYKVQLGAANPNGLPADLFATGEARWLEVQSAGQPEQPRTLLASVPYALKAADAATLGGLPASAFALAGTKTNASLAAAGPAAITPDGTTNVTTTGGTAGYLPVFTGASAVGNSILYSSSTGIGVGDVPNSTAVFDVNGKSIWRGLLNVSRAGTATTSTSYPSYAMFFQASSWDSASNSVHYPAFQLQAEPTGNNTASPGGTFNLLYTSNSATPAETGLYFNGDGTIHFATGQTFGATSATGVAFNGTSTSNAGVEGASTSGSGVLGTTAGNTLNAAGVLGKAGNVSGITSVAAGVWGDSYTQVGVEGTSHSSIGVYGDSTSSTGVEGISASTTVGNAGVLGVAGKRNTSGFTGIAGVWGDASAHVGVYGSSDQYAGVFGQSAAGFGVQGSSTSSNGVYGYSPNTSGIHGETGSTSFDDAAVYGSSDSVAAGVIGTSAAGAGGSFTGGTGGDGVDGAGGSASGSINYGGDGGSFSGGSGGSAGYGVYAAGGITYSPDSGGVGIYAVNGYAQLQGGGATYANAGTFVGNVQVQGVLNTDEGNVKIDDPADPANKYLTHASVESSEMMNIYTGNVTTDELGLATVTLPSWFQTLNTDFRYQLTVIGGRFAQAIVSKEIDNNQFTISTNASGVKVSWQVTAVRQDAFAKAHPLVVEETKPAKEQGFYIHPDLYGQPAEKQLEWGRNPAMMRHIDALRAAQKKRLADARPATAALNSTTTAAAKTAGTTP